VPLVHYVLKGKRRRKKTLEEQEEKGSAHVSRKEKVPSTRDGRVGGATASNVKEGGEIKLWIYKGRGEKRFN